MHFYTAKKPLVLPDITIEGRSIPVTSTSKLLGVKISESGTWQEHIDYIVTRGSKALYMLYIMRRFNPPPAQLLKVYTVYIRPLLEYCAPDFHAVLTASQAFQIERVQKRALKIIAGYHCTYQDLLYKFGIEKLGERRRKPTEDGARLQWDYQRLSPDRTAGGRADRAGCHHLFYITVCTIL